jgi:hypothetical protein
MDNVNIPTADEKRAQIEALGYHVQRTGDARVGLTWLNIAIPKDDQTT